MPTLSRRLTIPEMMAVNIRNAVENSTGGIDCEIEHPRLGWIKYTARADGEAEVQVAYARASGMGPKPYVPPPPTVEQLTERARAARERDYRREADPMFFKAAAGEIDRSDWLAKRDEIKARHPYPSE